MNNDDDNINNDNQYFKRSMKRISKRNKLKSKKIVVKGNNFRNYNSIMYNICLFLIAINLINNIIKYI